MKVTIRKLDENDKKRTFRFLKSVFGGWRALCQWDWKFEEVEEHLGRKAANWVVEDAGKIVGHLAFVPMELRVGDSILPACQLVDGALDKKYRHSGVYTNLVRQVLLDAKEKGNLAAFGFANRPSYRVYASLRDFQTICEITKMFKILSLRNALLTLRISLSIGELKKNGNDSVVKDLFLILGRKAISTSIDLVRNTIASAITCILGSKRYSVTRVPTIGRVETSALEERFRTLWPKLSKNFAITFERDAKYLRWRYINPAASYRIYAAERSGCLAGYVITASEEVSVNIGKARFSGLKVGFIVDLVAEDDVMIPLLLRAEEELRKQKVCFVNCWTTENSFSHHTLQRTRYYKVPKEIGKITLVASINSPHLQTTLSSTQAKDVLITLGDSDLV
jgi:predicted N-acetyltransferase YhbS